MSSLSTVKNTIAIASGKGGVGKSTCAVNLAVMAAQMGYKVGLLDGDIYGPSLPMMMGIEEKPTQNAQGKLQPIQRYGVECFSIGFLLAQDQPLIWRGPMVQTALKQLLFDVAWEELDFLFIDLPPGTGDAQLTLAQKASLQGAIIVSTPQDVALIDARKGLLMFERMMVPILGIIENMSFFECPHCHEKTCIFDEGKAEKEATLRKVPFLGALPLNLELRRQCDLGVPFVHQNPHSSLSGIYKGMIELIVKSLFR